MGVARRASAPCRRGMLRDGSVFAWGYVTAPHNPGVRRWPAERRLKRDCSWSRTTRTSSSCSRRACASPASRSRRRPAAPQAVDAARESRPDLVVLDVMLPDLDGFEVIRRMRDGGVRTPVVFLTARDATDDKIRGLTLGGDDYVTKPFSLEELTARIRAVLRRTGGRGRRRPGSKFADLELDEESHEVWRGRHAGVAVADRVQAAALPDDQRRPGAVQGADPRPRLALRLPWRRQHRRVVHLVPAPQGRHRRAAADPHPARRRVRAAPAVSSRCHVQVPAPHSVAGEAGRRGAGAGRGGARGHRRRELVGAARVPDRPGRQPARIAARIDRRRPMPHAPITRLRAADELPGRHQATSTATARSVADQRWPPEHQPSCRPDRQRRRGAGRPASRTRSGRSTDAPDWRMLITVLPNGAAR